MELNVESTTEDLKYLVYRTDFHEIKMKISLVDGETAITKYLEALKKKKVSPEEKENMKSLWIQKKMKLITSTPVDSDFYEASFNALRKKLFEMDHKEAIKEAKKQTTLEQHPKE